jgi:hypothetical protein
MPPATAWRHGTESSNVIDIYRLERLRKQGRVAGENAIGGDVEFAGAVGT